MRRWYETVRNAVLGERDPASRDYRYMALRLQKEFHCAAGRGLSVALFAPEHDEVTAEVAMMLSHSLAGELSSRVLLVDARVRPYKRGLTERLHLKERPGFAEAMQQGTGSCADWVQATAVAGVSVLPAGTGAGPVPVTNDRLKGFFDWAVGINDHVVVSIGAVQQDTRSLLTAAAADVVFMLALENRTLMRSLEDSHRMLHRSGARAVRTVVVNRGG